MNYKRIAIIIAMKAEATPIIDGLSMTPLEPPHSKLPMAQYTTKLGSTEICVTVNGIHPTFRVDCIGTEAATLSAHLTIDCFNPDIIINAGTAGGFISANARVGDVYLSNPMVCFHDRRIPIPGFQEYGVGTFPCINSTQIANYLGVKQGVVSTGSSLDCTPKDLEVMKSYNAEVKEMEAAAIAWVASLHKVPFLAIKSITDLIDTPTPTEDEFLKNLQYASSILSRKTIELIHFLAENNPHNNHN